MRRLTFGLRPPFVHLVANTVVPHCVGPRTRLPYGETPSTSPPASKPPASRTGCSYRRRQPNISTEISSWMGLTKSKRRSTASSTPSS